MPENLPKTFDEQGLQKPTFAEYEAWLESHLGHKDLRMEKTRFDQVVVKAVSDIENSDFWRSFRGNAAEFDDEYTARTSYKLFAAPDQHAPVLHRKSWESFFHKTYRNNVLKNAAWPDAPQGGWWSPENWYVRTNDIVRTAVVVKYLDGVEFLVQKLGVLAQDAQRSFRCDFEAKDEGYYAAHTYVALGVDVPLLNWDTERIDVQFEIQITTQLQDVIRRLTHADYEKRRAEQPADSDVAWQWQYRSAQFVPNYLGHILHYMEGMIMEVRDRPETAEGKK